MKVRLLVAALVLSLALVGVGGALAASQHHQTASRATRALTDIHVGRSKPELKAQMAYSTYIVEHFKKPANRWRLLPRHATCWTVRSRFLRVSCNHARLRLRAHRWLLTKSTSVYAALFAPKVDPSLLPAFECIHHYEGAWTANTGNGYYGGLQMDWGFMSHYGAALLNSKGTADRWTPAEQINVAITAHNSGRGFGPWPNTARACGLL